MDRKYDCLVLDHDDTNVDSTAHIHHPIYLELMAEMRPEITPLDLDGFIEINMNGGVKPHYMNDLKFTNQEWEYAFKLWKEHPQRQIIPTFYEGIIDVINDFRNDGGLITVVSHSNAEAIAMHFQHYNIQQPDRIIGATNNSNHNKPHAWPLEQIMQQYNLQPNQLVVVDDLAPGIEMAEKVGVDTIAAGWGHKNPTSFNERCTFYAPTVKDLRDIIFN
jgi:phosphoglycolate phosphatase/pyrophosphatase PpaX